MREIVDLKKLGTSMKFGDLYLCSDKDERDKPVLGTDRLAVYVGERAMVLNKTECETVEQERKTIVPLERKYFKERFDRFMAEDNGKRFVTEIERQDLGLGLVEINNLVNKFGAKTETANLQSVIKYGAIVKAMSSTEQFLELKKHWRNENQRPKIKMMNMEPDSIRRAPRSPV